MIFNLDFLPAKYGDCIWVEYGEKNEPKKILIDGGTGGTKKHIREKLKQTAGKKHFELMVVTHIDRDHIEGVLTLLEDRELGFTVGDFWFNGWNHLPGNDDLEPFGAVQGERLTAALLKHGLNWNGRFGKKRVYIKNGKPKTLTLDGGLTLTLLSPTWQQLEVLKSKWEEEVKAANLDPGFGLQLPDEDVDIESFGEPVPDVDVLNKEQFHEDEAAANGSSIAFIAEYRGKKVLFAGDAFPSVVLNSLNEIDEDRSRFDLVKLSHHASAHNTSPELIKKLDCKKFIISTNGSIYKHPSAVTVARLIKLKGKGTELFFNYRSKYNEVWDLESLKQEHQYTATYPESEGIQIQLL